MNNIIDYITEKLKVTSNSIVHKGDLDDPKFYEDCDIVEWVNDIDDALSKIGDKRCPFKKRKAGKGRNANWYKFYCYIYYNGPIKKVDVIKAIKGDTSSQYAETFTDLKRYNICSSEKGLWKAENPKDWDLNAKRWY